GKRRHPHRPRQPPVAGRPRRGRADEGGGDVAGLGPAVAGDAVARGRGQPLVGPAPRRGRQLHAQLAAPAGELLPRHPPRRREADVGAPPAPRRLQLPPAFHRLRRRPRSPQAPALTGAITVLRAEAAYASVWAPRTAGLRPPPATGAWAAPA